MMRNETLTLEVILEGGPADLPQRHRVRPPDGAHLRIPRLGGFEHYEDTGEHQLVDGEPLAIFRWRYRTRPAE